MKQWIGCVAVLGLSATMMTACVGSASEGDDEQDGYVYSTAIEIDAKGQSHVVAVERLSAEEMQRQIDVRRGVLAERSAPTSPGEEGVGTAAEALSLDPPCGGSSLWVYDQTFDGTGANHGHRLCIKGPNDGGDTGGSYSILCRAYTFPAGICIGFWGQNVKAYWPGSDSGYFPGTGVCSQGSESFSAYQQMTNANVCAESATSVHFF